MTTSHVLDWRLCVQEGRGSNIRGGGKGKGKGVEKRIAMFAVGSLLLKWEVDKCKWITHSNLKDGAGVYQGISAGKMLTKFC